MRALIAVDKFKGSLTQSEITAIISNFLASRKIDFESALIADGGDGSIDALVSLGWERKSLDVTGPLDNQHSADFALSTSGKRIALEVAELCGIQYLKGELDPYNASSRALGEAMKVVNLSEFNELLICVGGSASIDGGIGVLQGVGVSVRDRNGKDVSNGLRGLKAARAINLSSLDDVKRILGKCQIRVLSDTDLPLTGLNGAVMSFGKQKGLSLFGRITAEIAMRRWRKLLIDYHLANAIQKSGSGSAGGIGFILNSCLGAKIQSGSEYFFEESAAASKIKRSSTVITGEGRIDETTLTGKSIMPILRAAKSFDKRIVLICGSADTKTLDLLKKVFPITGVINLSNSKLPLDVLMKDADKVLLEQLDSSFQDRWVR